MDLRRGFKSSLIYFSFIGFTSCVSHTKNPSEDKCQHDKKTFRCVKYIKNYDADTITVHIPRVHPLIGKNMSIRVLGVDTPEIRTKDKCEKELALRAKNKVAEFLKQSNRIDLINIQRGKYFRIVADLLVDGESLSKFLLKQGLAYPYKGGRKPKMNWCKFL